MVGHLGGFLFWGVAIHFLERISSLIYEEVASWFHPQGFKLALCSGIHEPPIFAPISLLTDENIHDVIKNESGREMDRQKEYERDHSYHNQMDLSSLMRPGSGIMNAQSSIPSDSFPAIGKPMDKNVYCPIKILNLTQKTSSRGLQWLEWSPTYSCQITIGYSKFKLSADVDRVIT